MELLTITYNLAAFFTLCLSFFVLLLMYMNVRRRAKLKPWQLIQMARKLPIHFTLTVITFLIFVSSIGTYMFPPQLELTFVVRTIFFGTHLLVGSFVILWASTKIDDWVNKMENDQIEKEVLKTKLEIEKIKEPS